MVLQTLEISLCRTQVVHFHRAIDFKPRQVPKAQSFGDVALVLCFYMRMVKHSKQPLKESVHTQNSTFTMHQAGGEL